jgi:hypothetical protein
MWCFDSSTTNLPVTSATLPESFSGIFNWDAQMDIWNFNCEVGQIYHKDITITTTYKQSTRLITPDQWHLCGFLGLISPASHLGSCWGWGTYLATWVGRRMVRVGENSPRGLRDTLRPPV